MINKIFYNHIMADANPPPSNRDVLNEISIMLKELVKDVKVIKDDVHYIKILNMTPKKPAPLILHPLPEKPTGWFWS